MNRMKRFRTNGPNLVSEIIDGEAVIINLEKGSYYTLDKAGAVIWNCIKTGASYTEILETTLQRYEGEPTEVERGVQSLLDQLELEGLLATDEDPGLPAKPADFKSETESEMHKSDFEAPVLSKYTDMEAILMLDPIHEVDSTGWPKADSGSK